MPRFRMRRKTSRKTFETGLGDGLGQVKLDPRVGGRVFSGPLGFAAYSAQEVLGSVNDLLNDRGVQGRVATEMMQRFTGLERGSRGDDHSHAGRDPHSHEGGGEWHQHEDD